MCRNNRLRGNLCPERDPPYKKRKGSKMKKRQLIRGVLAPLAFLCLFVVMGCSSSETYEEGLLTEGSVDDAESEEILAALNAEDQSASEQADSGSSDDDSSEERVYTTTDTGGCSCEQIIDELGLGRGQTKFGCSERTMKRWTRRVP